MAVGNKKYFILFFVVLIIAGGLFLLFKLGKLPFGQTSSLNLTNSTIQVAGASNVKIFPASADKIAQLPKAKLSSSLDTPVEITKSDGTGGNLASPVTISFTFKDGSEALKKIESASQKAYIARFDERGGFWIKLPTKFDPAAKTLTAQTNHLTVFDARWADSLTEPVVQSLIDQMNQSTPKDDRIVGSYFIVDKEVSVSDPSSGLSKTFESPTDFRHAWGCNEDPTDGFLKNPQELDIDPVQVASGGVAQSNKQGSTETHVNVDVVGVWNYDVGDDNTLSVTVTDQSNKPVKKGTIKLINMRNGKIKTMTTDQSGAANIKFQTGGYRMTFSKSGCEARQDEKLFCGWGPILTDPVQQSNWNWNPTTSCETAGTGGVHEATSLTYYEPPPVDMNMQLDMDLLKEKGKSKTANFWEGVWKGTLIMKPDLREEQWLGKFPYITDIQSRENDVVDELEIHLIDDGAGRVSNQSFVKIRRIKNWSGSAYAQACAPTVGCFDSKKNWSEPAAGEWNSTPVDLVQETATTVKFRPNRIFPFEQISGSEGYYIIHNFPVITLEKSSE